MQQITILDVEEELKEMREAWGRDKLLAEIKDDKLNKTSGKLTTPVSISRGRKTYFYDGIQEFETLKESMKPLPDSDNLIHFKMIHANSSGNRVTELSSILCDRVGYIEKNPEPFENTLHRGEPILVNLAEESMIPGVMLALTSLNEGDSALFLINPQLGLGDLGAPPSIPPKSFLLYFIRVHKVWIETKLTTILERERQKLQRAPDDMRYEAIEEYKKSANQLLQDGHFKEAIRRYKFALQTINECYTNDDEISDMRSPIYKLTIILMQNLTIAYSKMGWHAHACNTAKSLLAMEPKNIKAIYLMTKSKLLSGNKNGALHWLEWADKVSPGGSSFDELRLQLNVHHRDEKKKMDEITRKMANVFKVEKK